MSTRPMLCVDIARQRLAVHAADGGVMKHYVISTSRFGTGNQRGSYRTPLGQHLIRAKIGAGAPIGAVFVGRRPTGEIYDAALGLAHPERDWILTRILWLSGMEVGHNRLGEVDTMRRYIYIHGSPDGDVLGVPSSIGCVRMSNHDVLELFEIVSVGTRVLIE